MEFLTPDALQVIGPQTRRGPLASVFLVLTLVTSCAEVTPETTHASVPGTISRPPVAAGQPATTGPAAASARPNVKRSGPDSGAPTFGPGRGFVDLAPWVVYYGQAEAVPDLTKVSTQYKLVILEGDPDKGDFSAAQIDQLKGPSGATRVLSYINFGACENDRTYWATAPAGFKAASAMKNLGAYGGYPKEVWMDPADADFQHLFVDYIAPRLVESRHVDGLFLDNVELLDHGKDDVDGPCSDATRQAGVALIKKLRDRYPDILIVTNHGTADVVRAATVDGISYPSLLDGVIHEAVFTHATGGEKDASLATYSVLRDDEVVRQFTEWHKLALAPGGRKFLIGSLDFVNDCSNTTAAKQVFDASRALGFSPSVSDKAAGLHTLCDWGL
jgi:cysteinyl-tRNA synthetase